MLQITAIEWSSDTYTDRIPFRKPALDDIEFEPEEYQDIVDGRAIQKGTMTRTTFGHMGFSATPNFASNAFISAGFIEYSKTNGRLQHESGTYVGLAIDFNVLALTLGSGNFMAENFEAGLKMDVTVVDGAGAANVVTTGSLINGSNQNNKIDAFFVCDVPMEFVVTDTTEAVFFKCEQFAEFNGGSPPGTLFAGFTAVLKE